jgi:hypothetical protein
VRNHRNEPETASCRSPVRVCRRVAAVLLLVVALSGLAAAGPLKLVSGTVDGGGGHSQGARFALEGTIGQPDAGRAEGSRFVIDSGFWSADPALPASNSIFRDSFED